MRTDTYDENEWALVPKKPTSAMKTGGIGVEVYQDSPPEFECLTWGEVAAIYEAMLAAAPDHPATSGDAEDAEDAARYRMARRLPLVLAHDRVAPHRPEKFDAMIDAAMRASKGGE